MRTVIVFLFSLSLTGLYAVRMPGKPEKKRTLGLVFHHTIGQQRLELGTPAVNIFGETITVERFRYYLSNFSITGKDGKTIALPQQYFLVDEADSLSKTIVLSIPDIPVAGIHFLLGVDSVRNVSGVQTGALDPAKGMFWTWNSGYVMAKLEGTADAAASPGHRFTYHIGGFRTGMDATRKIELPVTDLTKSGDLFIHITADLNRWFMGRSELRMSETPVCHSPGALAVRIADNYASLFSVNSMIAINDITK